MIRWALAFTAACCGACSKPAAENVPATGDTGPATPQASVSAPESSARPLPAKGVAAATATATATRPWSGHYTSAAGTLYIPPEWKGVRWSVAESPAGIGEGTLTLSVDTTTGRVSGTVDGPLGPAVVDGFSGDGGVAGTLVRKDPSDRGFTGTLVGAMDGDKLTGTLQMSAADVNAVRKATFSLTQP